MNYGVHDPQSKRGFGKQTSLLLHPCCTSAEQTEQYNLGRGGTYEFHKKYGYGLRALAEAQISRIKRCIPAKLLARKIESRESEGIVIANIIDRWNSLDRCASVKNTQWRPQRGDPYPSEQTSRKAPPWKMRATNNDRNSASRPFSLHDSLHEKSACTCRS